MAASQRSGSNMMLAAVLAVLSYVPFEWVAKGTLVFAIILFILDPIRPVSRLLAVLSVFVVGVLSRARRRWLAEQDVDEALEGVSAEESRGQDAAAVSRRPKKED